MIHRFAEFSLDDGAGLLSGPTGPIALRPRSFALLQVLVERAPDLVGRDQLIDAVWGHDALSPNVLPQTISEIRQALGDSAQAPRLIGTQHRRGYRLLVPVRRSEVPGVAAAAADTEEAAGDAGPAAVRRGGIRVVHGLLVLAGAVVLAALLMLADRPPTPTGSGAVSERPAVVLLARSAGPDDDWLRGAGSGLLTVALAADDRLQLLRGDGRDGNPGGSDARWQAWLREVLGAGHALDTTWTQVGGEVVLSWSLLDLDDGRVRGAGQLRDHDLAAVCREAGREVRALLRLIEFDPGWLAGLPQAPAAREAYYRGLAALAAGDPGQALDELAQAIADPAAGVRIHLAHASALRQTGRMQLAREAFENLGTGIQGLALGERLRVEAEAALADHRAGDAVSALSALYRLLPDDREVGLLLADAQLRARRAADAGATLAALDALASGQGEAPRWHLLRARLHLLQQQRPEAASAASRALDLADSLDLPVLAAQARIELAHMARANGELAGARDQLVALLAQPAIDAAVQDEARVQLGSVWRDLGDFDAASSAIEAALAGFSARGDRAGALRARIELHVIDSERGRSEQALAALQALAPELAALGDDHLSARWHNTLGVQAIRNGQVEIAETHLQRAAGLARRTGQPAIEAGAWGNLGQVRARERRLPEAEGYWQRALEVFHDSGDRMGEAITLGNLAAAASAQGRLPHSRDLNARALELLRTLDARQHLARTAYNLGLALEREGELVHAEALFAEALAAFSEGAAGDPLPTTAAALARVRLALADPAGAATALVAVEASHSHGGAPLARSHLRAQRGQLAAATGDLQAARDHHEAALALRREDGRPGWAEMSELDLLLLDLGGGDAGRVRAGAERIAQRLARQGDARAEVRARLVEAEALLRLGERGQALDLAVAARQRLASEPDAALSLALDRIQVLASGGRDQAQAARLSELADEAEAMGLRLFAWRCRIDAGLDDAGLAESVRAAGLAGLLLQR